MLEVMFSPQMIVILSIVTATFGLLLTGVHLLERRPQGKAVRRK